MAASDGYTCPYSGALLKKAEEELNETPERRDRELIKLRDLMKRNGALKCRTDTLFLLRFLRARKFDSDRAIKLLINYFTIRAEHSESIGPIIPSKSALDTGISFVLPEKDAEGRAIVYLRIGQWDPSTHTAWDMAKLDILNMEHIVENEENQVNGVVILGDFGGLSMTHIFNLSPSIGKVMTSIMQEGFPLRVKGIHMVNEPTIFDLMFAMIKPFMSSKIIGRIKLHGSDLESLHGVFDKSALPRELGGELPPTEELVQMWKKKLLAQESMFEELSKMHIELPKSVQSVPKDTGIVGTGFRKLDVD